MTTSDQQWRFLQDAMLLVLHAARLGFKLTGGDLYRDPRAFGEWGEPGPYGHRHSRHKLRMAIDFNLWTPNANGVLVRRTSTLAHLPLGFYWERLDPANRWGGRFEDGNHYERKPGWRDGSEKELLFA